jgi:hypothetical protein
MQAESSKSPLNVLPRLILLASLVFMSVALLKGWRGTIHDLHAFRQTQTAITVKYLLKGGPWLAYETPVLGPPWSIPFEFPLYQWLVALTAQIGIFPVEQSGRLVGILMFLATLPPLYTILKSLTLEKNQIFLMLALYCLSPEYLFWSRTFMIESTALALSMYYLTFIVWRYDKRFGPERENGLLWIGMALAGALAAMVKITTFFAFFVAGIAFFLWRSFGERRDAKWWREGDIGTLLKFFVFAVLIPVAALFLWTSFSDTLKSANPLARHLTSTALREWNFGTLSDKLSLKTWMLFFTRIVRDLIGNSWLLVLAVPAALFCRRQRLIIAIVLLVLFLLPMATFTNLYYRHNYYAYANGIFLIAAIGVICSDLWEADHLFKRVIGMTLLCCVLAFSSYHYLVHYFPKQGVSSDLSLIKNDIDNIIPNEDDIIVVFGAGWSSAIPYYLDRRAVMFNSNDINDQDFHETLKNLATYRVGAIIFVGEAGDDAILLRGALSAFRFPKNRMINYRQMLVFFNR